ncbi:MAG: Ig-like domain-containing protein [Eubacteriales bacterium]|nr:Ig-like domain-containing protein [Eubacteriales bacterium]
MKRKKSGWIAWLLLLICMLVPLPGNKAEAVSGMMKAGEIRMPGVSGSALPEAGKVSSRAGRTAIAGFSYGAQLTEVNEKAVYNALKTVSDMRSFSVSNPVVVNLPKQESFTKGAKYNTTAAWKKLYQQINHAVDAYYMDYCEDYWVGGFVFYVNSDCERVGKITRIGMGPSDYYSGIRSELGMTDAEMQKAINAVGGNNRYEVVKSAHDYILKLVTYPDLSAGNYGYYHVINGGLLSKYNHKAVCDCYARLFHLLCRSKGIPSILAAGGSERDTSGNIIDDHIWNYVQMEDGKWYLVDCTWDDGIVDAVGYNGTFEYTYFLAGSSSEGIDGTVGEEHMAVGVLSSAVSYTPFSIPALSSSAYVYSGASGTASVTKIALNKTSVSLKCSQAMELACTITPSNAAIYNLKWTSSNSNVARVSSVAGRVVVRATGTGTAVITASSGSARAACKVTVSHTPGSWKVVKKATGSSEGKKEQKCTACGKVIKTETIPKTFVKLNESQIPLQKKKSTTALKISSYTGGDKVKSWKSSNSKVVTVNSKGKLTAKKKGTAVITVTMVSGASAKCKVTVQNGKVGTKTLKLTRTAITLKKGEKYTIGKVRTPITTTDKITYKSSNKKIATVNSQGKITAKKAGKVKITVKSGSKKAIITVTVK